MLDSKKNIKNMLRNIFLNIFIKNHLYIKILFIYLQNNKKDSNGFLVT